MKVNLIKEAEYELNESKCSKMPFDVFCRMSGYAAAQRGETEGSLPSVRIFANIDEFRKSGDSGKYDSTKDVFVLSNGQFCIFLKGGEIKEDKPAKPKAGKQEAVQDEPTNTEEDKGQVP